MSFKINQLERDILKGLPYLQRLIYVFALRPYMDFATGMVGIKRGISYQSIAEELYVEPHAGYQSGSPSKDQIRRALRRLESIGIILICSTNKKLIIKCLLATQDNSGQNKVATKPPREAATSEANNYREKQGKAASANIDEVATPPVSGISTLSNTEIPENFCPAKNTLSKAKALECPTAENRDELEKFISYHQSKGNKRVNWDAEFLNWLLRTKDYHKEKKNVKNKHPNTRQAVRSTHGSAVDRVLNANQALIEKPNHHYEQRHCVVVGEYD